MGVVRSWELHLTCSRHTVGVQRRSVDGRMGEGDSRVWVGGRCTEGPLGREPQKHKEEADTWTERGGFCLIIPSVLGLAPRF